MENFILNETARGGCFQNATKNFAKTDQKQTEAALGKATRFCTISSCNNNNQSSTQTNLTNNNKITTTRQFNVLLLATMTLVTILQMPSTANAAALRASSSLESAIIEDARFGSHDGDQIPRTRLRKRHTDDAYFLANPHENSTTLEWENPCWGSYQQVDENSAEDPQLRCESRKLLLDALKNFARIQYSMHSSLSGIDTSNMKTYNMYRSHYNTFLPTLKRNSKKIALKRWYRNMQTYVAAFAYLRRKQNEWDHDKQHYASETTTELNTLFHSARKMLCEIETTINNSFPNSNEQKLFRISRDDMNEKLKFFTREAAAAATKPVEPNLFDLRFVKHYYFHYVARMWRTLRRNPRKCHIPASSAIVSDSEADVSHSSGLVYYDLPSELSSSGVSYEWSEQQKRHHKRHHHKSAELPLI